MTHEEDEYDCDDPCVHGSPYGGEDCCECEEEAEAEHHHRESVEAQVPVSPLPTAFVEIKLQHCEHGFYAETCALCDAGTPEWEGEY